MNHPPPGNIFRKDSDSDDHVPFATAFPRIAELRVEVSESGEGNSGLGLRKFNRHSIREHLNCSSHRCLGRGFWMGNLLRDMVRLGETQRLVVRACESREEAGNPCPNIFTVDVKLTFHVTEM